MFSLQRYRSQISGVAVFSLMVVFSASFEGQIGRPADTKNHYVAVTGSDWTNDGSRQHPWRTIQYAADIAQPGWTIHVGAGTYNVKSGIVTNNSGTPSSHIVYIGDYDKSTSTWSTKLVSAGTGVWTTDASYIDIIGFDMTSKNPSAVTGLHTGGHYIRIMDNYVHDIYSDSPGAAIMIGGTGSGPAEVRRNLVIRVGHTAGGSTDNQCIYSTQSYTTIVNNIVLGCNKYGIQIYSHIPGGSNYNVISNNTVLASYRGIVVGGEDTGGGPPTVDYNTITNNIVYGITSFGFNVVGILGRHNITSNNLTYNNGANYSRTYTIHNNDIVADPLFVNYKEAKNGDYHLRPGSPAISAGTSLFTPSTDFDSNPRQWPSSVGAYEFYSWAAS